MLTLTETRTDYRLADARENRAFVKCQIKTCDAGDVAGWESELPAIDAEIQARIYTLNDANADYSLAVVGYRADARRLRDALKTRGISQAAFATECGCSPSNVSNHLAAAAVWPIPRYIWTTAERLGLI